MAELVDKTRAIRAGEELDTEKLEPYLIEHLDGVQGPLTIEQYPAGHSNLTYLIRLGDEAFVMRRPPFGSKVKTAHDMGREYRVLSRLYRAFPTAPEAVHYCEDAEIIGAPFYVMRRIEGVILRRQLPAGFSLDEAQANKLSTAFVEHLAALHGVDYEAVGLGDLGKPDGYIERQVTGWIKRYHAAETETIEDVEPVATWMTERMPEGTGGALVHNDYKYDNLVLDPADVTRIIGVLDWEMSTLGEPLMDLATALGYWIEPGDPPEYQMMQWGPTAVPGALTRSELVARYGELTGRDVSNIVYHYVFALFKLGVIVQQIFYRYHHGMTKDERFAPLGEVAKICFRTARRAAGRDSIDPE